MYIPPPGLYFRLVDTNGYVLYSRTGPHPEVGHFQGPKYDDQLFSLIHGKGSRQGTYAIKGKASGNVLFSRNSPNPCIGHICGDGKYDDNWFQFEEGSGTRAGKFRILCPATRKVWVSRTHRDPYVCNHPAEEVYGDQFFAFAFDDNVVKKIEYDVASGRILASGLVTLAEQSFTNNTNHVQEMLYNLNERVRHTSKFEYSNGIKLAVNSEIQSTVTIPSVSKGRIGTFDVSTTITWHFGPEESFAKTYTTSIPVKAAPHQTVHAVSTVTHGTLEVPFTITLVQNSSGMETQMRGKWKGVSSWNVHHDLSISQSTPDCT